MKQKWLLTGTALLLAAALAGCGNMPAADQAAKISMEQAQTAALDAATSTRRTRTFFRDARASGVA